jgi:prevent-host-death family protein
MSKRYSIAEARSSLPSIVDDAEAGVEIELTRRGKPVAAIVSLKELARMRRGRVSFASAYREFLSRHSLGTVNVPRTYFDRLRGREPGRKVNL